MGPQFTRAQSAGIWDIIFQDDKWLQAVSKLKSHSSGPPRPALVGSDLLSPSPAYLALIVSDWSGDAIYEKAKLFSSFREQDYTYDKARYQVRFKHSGITLHIGDAITGDEWIKMKDPSRLFRQVENDVETAVRYYEDGGLYTIKPEQIGGIENQKGEDRVKYICSIPLTFGNKEPAIRVIYQGDDMQVRVVSKQVKDRNGRAWVSDWRLAKRSEEKWSIVSSER